MIFKFLSLEMFILGQKASKTTFHKKYSIQSRNVKKAIFLRKSFILKIRVRNFYNQILGNQQVNLIARAKLGSHFRSRRVWGSSKTSCEIAGLFDDFVARFSSLISELHSLRPPLRPPLKGTPAFAPDSAHYAPTFATKICLKIIKNPGSHNFF